jgi:light-regulated signal transduction histidine kinase (bacteriophytochrome)
MFAKKYGKMNDKGKTNEELIVELQTLQQNYNSLEELYHNCLAEKKQTEETLRETVEMFSMFMDLSPIYTYIKEVTPTESRVLKASENYIEMIGIRGSDMVGKTMHDLFPSEFATKITADDWNVISGGQVLKIEEELNGRYYTTIKFPLLLQNKKLLAGYTIDITDLKLTEQELLRNKKELTEALELANQSRLTLLSVLEDQRIAELKIQQLNAELEDRVLERTALLEASNKELEAFAYSVSHDLRAPLRAVNSFAEILLQDYSNNLEDEAKRICSVIRDNSLKMGKLIDGLLNFSRLNRTELMKTRVNMRKLIELAYAELPDPQRKQKIKFIIADKIHKANADVVLIRQVWANLIQNAVKFTSNATEPEIEISSTKEPEQIIYCVKDNGAGFDMKYVNKLFGVFQRLHSDKEFEGTGVGLALVQRILHRHGGRVWATGEPGRGAAFYFSLPK